MDNMSLMDKILFHLKEHFRSNNVYYKKYFNEKYDKLHCTIYEDDKIILNFDLEGLYESMIFEGNHIILDFYDQVKSHLENYYKQ